MKLPEVVENVLFDELGAQYEQLRGSAARNLDADENRIRTYLGTYFPRSFVEGYGVFRNLVSNRTLRSHFDGIRTVTILDIGSGTGGYALGALWALRELVRQERKCTLISVDGNPTALRYQQHIIRRCFRDSLFWHGKCSKFGSGGAFGPTLGEVMKKYSPGDGYDIILASKFVSEFIHPHYEGDTRGLYQQLLDVAGSNLALRGLFVLNDVTTSVPTGHDKAFIPEIMSRETKEYLHTEDSPMRPVLPLSCAFWHSECADGEGYGRCFHQKEFRVSHRKKQNDISKVAYRVFSRQKWAEAILHEEEAKPTYAVDDAGRNYCLRGRHSTSCVSRPTDAFLFPSGDVRVGRTVVHHVI